MHCCICNADIEFVNATDLTVNWNAPAVLMSRYQGVILGGSGEFDFDGNRAEDDPAKSTTYEFAERLSPFFEYLFIVDRLYFY